VGWPSREIEAGSLLLKAVPLLPLVGDQSLLATDPLGDAANPVATKWPRTTIT
jgi:hypothetical protein